MKKNNYSMQVKNRKSILRYGWYILLIVNAVFIFLMLTASLAWYIPPTTTTLFAYPGLIFPVISGINLAFVIFWIIFRKWKFLFLSILPFILCIKPVTTYFPLNLTKIEVPDESIKFLSYNVRAFNWLKMEKGKEENDIIAYIRDSGADIVCIQEFVSIENGGKSSANGIQKRLKHYPYYSFVNFRPGTSHTYGVACFSKYPINKTIQIPLESDNGSAIFRLDINDKIISVVVNHLESNGITAQGKELYREFFKENKKIKIDDIAHNIKDRLGTAYRKRTLQAQIVKKWINREKTEGIIVCGDFNDTPVSYTYHKIKGDLIDAYVENEFGPRITYHENHFWFKIDFIMHSKNIQSYNCTVEKINYSDHYPLWSYLKIN